MVCAHPPALRDRELLAYLDQEAGEHVAAHLQVCPDCRQRAEELSVWHNRLTATLFRVTCPSPQRLGEHHLGLLPGEEASLLREHLGECPHCRRELDQLGDYLGALARDVDLSLGERVRVWIAELVGGAPGDARPGRSAPSPALAPVMAGLRGGEGGPRLYRAGEAQIALEVGEDAEHPGLYLLLVLVSGLDPDELWGHLWLGERRVAEAAVDEIGNLVIGGLVPGRYELVLRGPEVEIEIRDLDVGPN